jgi:hypothetical protein
LSGDPEIKKKSESFHIHFPTPVAAVKLSEWNSIDEKETCGVKTCGT